MSLHVPAWRALVGLVYFSSFVQARPSLFGKLSLRPRLSIMAPVGGASMFDTAALERRQALQGASGPMAILRNAKVFGIACFACLGGLLYGYNQGVFSGVLAMNSFNARRLAQALTEIDQAADLGQTWECTPPTRPRRVGLPPSSNSVPGLARSTPVSSPRSSHVNTPSSSTSPSSSSASSSSALRLRAVGPAPSLAVVSLLVWESVRSP